MFTLSQNGVTYNTSDPTHLGIYHSERTSRIIRVLRIPVIPPSQIRADESYYVQLQVKLGEGDSRDDSELLFFLSDNNNAIGIILRDMGSVNDDKNNFCYGVEGDDEFPNGIQGKFGILQHHNMKIQSAEEYTASSQPTAVAIFFKPNQNFGSCSVIDGIPHINTVSYVRQLNTPDGVFIDVYIDNDIEKHEILFIKIKVVVESLL